MSFNLPSNSTSAAPTLTTARLVLRAHRLSDFEDSAALWGDARVMEHITGVPSTREESWARLTRYFGMWAMMGFGFWVVEDRATGAFLGEVGLGYFRRALDANGMDAPEAGWVLTPQAQGRGVATEAMVAVLDWVDAQDITPRLVCMVAPENGASIKVAEKCGFTHFGEGDYHGLPAVFLHRMSGEAPGD